MIRSLRIAACAASLFVLVAGSANAESAPMAPTTGTTAATPDFTLPAECTPLDHNTTMDETHGAQVRACIRALRAELSETDDHSGLGQWVSALAHERGRGRADGDD